MKNNKEIEAGDNSTNIQAENVTIQKTGLSYSDVKEIAMDVFKSNFYDLGEKAEEIANERAESIINKYLEKLKKENPDMLKKTEEPDMRYVIYEAQKNHARRGDKNIEELLTDLLVKRTKNENESLEKLVLNQSLEIIPKLTLKQINILSLIFLVRYLNFTSPVPIEFFIFIVNEMKKDLIIREYDIFNLHLESAGCLSTSIGSADFKRILTNKFPQINNEVEAVNLINSNPNLSSLQTIWDNSQLCHCELTSVGIAIALSNINIKTGQEWDLGIWIKE